jgi:hypothetical protein
MARCLCFRDCQCSYTLWGKRWQFSGVRLRSNLPCLRRNTLPCTTPRLWRKKVITPLYQPCPGKYYTNQERIYTQRLECSLAGGKPPTGFCSTGLKTCDALSMDGQASTNRTYFAKLRSNRVGRTVLLIRAVLQIHLQNYRLIARPWDIGSQLSENEDVSRVRIVRRSRPR